MLSQRRGQSRAALPQQQRACPRLSRGAPVEQASRLWALPAPAPWPGARWQAEPDRSGAWAGLTAEPLRLSRQDAQPREITWAKETSCAVLLASWGTSSAVSLTHLAKWQGHGC